MKKRGSPKAALVVVMGLALLASCRTKSKAQEEVASPSVDSGVPAPDKPDTPQVRHPRIEEMQRDIDAASDAMRKRFEGVEGIDD